MKQSPVERVFGVVRLLIVGALVFIAAASNTQAGPVVLHLKNGDRIAGELISENETQVVVKTPWAGELTISREHLERTEAPAIPAAPAESAAPAQAVAAKTNAPAPVQATAAAKPPAAKKADQWKFDIKVGADMIRGERDRDIFFGQAAITYAHPYPENPKKFLRNRMDYRADYSTTDGNKSANRMSAANKTDADVFEHAYFYNYVGGGYDEVRRINGQYEIGPGIGYHLFTQPKFVANIEGGPTYQYQDRDADGELESLYGRVGQDFTWKIVPKITLTQRSALLVSFESIEELQFRFEANLSFGIVQNVSLNLTAIELYDTRPVTGISRNEFQLRSAIGLGF